jgi:hypothetical protein
MDATNQRVGPRDETGSFTTESDSAAASTPATSVNFDRSPPADLDAAEPSDEGTSSYDSSYESEGSEEYLPEILAQVLRSESGRGIADILQDIHAVLLAISTSLKAPR